MRRFGCMLFAWLASPILFVSALLAQNNGGLQFALTDLGTLGGGASIGNAINNKGQIVGYIYKGTGTMCFSWQAGTTPVTFAGGTKPPSCIATAVSVDGRIAGQIILTKTAGNWAPLRRETNGSVILLNELPGSSGASRAWGIYKSSVVGQSGYPPLAVQWDYYGNVTPLLNTYSEAFAINSKGHVVGAVQGPSQGNPWLWQNGSLTYLPAPGSNPWAFAYTINPNDAIGGFTYVPGSMCMAYWYTGVLTNLDCGYNAQPAVGISSDGWVLGGHNASTGHCGPYFGGNSSDRCATLSVPGCSVADVNTLLDSSGTGWVLWEAAGINDAHQIVANGLSPIDGAEHAVLLTPNNQPLCYGL